MRRRATMSGEMTAIVLPAYAHNVASSSKAFRLSGMFYSLLSCHKVEKVRDATGDGHLDGQRIFIYDVGSPLPAVGEGSG